MTEIRRFLISEVCEHLGVEQRFVTHCIQERWIFPSSPESFELDEEDIARLELICELKEDFGVNEEAIPVILHLLDQIYSARRQARAFQERLHQRRSA